MAQIAYSVAQSLGQPGQLYGSSSRWWIDTYTAGATISPGQVVFQSTTDKLVTTAVTATHAPAAVDTAIISTPLAASATLWVTAVAAGFDGAQGATLFANGVSRNLRYTLSNSADWDINKGFIIVDGRLHGRRVQEVMHVIDAGNTVLLGTQWFDIIEQVRLGPQAGVGATLVLGTGVKYGPNVTALGVAVAKHASETTTYAAGDEVPVLRMGPIWALPEDAVTPVQGADGVFCRVIVGTGALGALRGNADGTFTAPESIPLIGWEFRTIAGAAAPSVLNVNLKA